MLRERGEYDVEGCPKLWEEELKLTEKLENCCELKEQIKLFREKKSDLDKSGQILHKLGLLYKRRALDFLWKLHFALSVFDVIGNTPITRDIRHSIPRIRTSIRFAFIRSAALMNAAIVRNPSNAKQIGKDLDVLYRLVLEAANAKQVIYKINEIVKVSKDKVNSFRKKTCENLEKLENIPENISDEEVRERQKGKTEFMKKLQTLVSQNYADTMKYISSKVQQIMGNPPCRYAIVGMGSLAREEITPFSDFEHIILLEDEMFENMNEDDDSVKTESVLEYFRWFCVVFFMVVLGLKETRLYNVSIPSLNNNQNKKFKWFYDDHTPSGISFDVMALNASHFPLGRQEKTKNKPWTTELIKSVSRMVKYLDEDVDKKDGYKLANVLSNPCFVYGDESLYEKFVELSSNKIDAGKITGVESFQSQLDEDLENFDVDKILDSISGISYQPIGIKKFLFRSSTLFISALGRIHLNFEEFVSTSPFEVIKKLLNRQVLTQAGAHELAYAVAISCEVRLKLYFEKKQQNDISRNQFNIEENIQPLAPEIVNAIGKESFLDYIGIAQELHRTLKMREKTYKYQSTKNQIANRITNASKLGLLNKVIQLYQKHQNGLSEVEKISLISVFGQSLIMTGNFDQGLPLIYAVFNLPFIDLKSKLELAGIILKSLRFQRKRDDAISDFVKTNIERLNPREDFVQLLELHYMYGSYVITVLGSTLEASNIFQKMWDHLSNLEKLLPTFQGNLRKELEVCLQKYKPAYYIGWGRCDYKNGYYFLAIIKFKMCETELDESIEPSFQYRSLTYGLLSNCYVCINDPRVAREYCEKYLEVVKNVLPTSKLDCRDELEEMEMRKKYSHDPAKFKKYRFRMKFSPFC
ncbi:unnamed protein product [Clavelina lepadiformis]|uniref:Protein-PII uridylyltransferase N-terminal domain-containing protein n=1 Tax=Clavelina lepadiformis TaxID=159417 RepID=A0ABP0FQ56_CLALP